MDGLADDEKRRFISGFLKDFKALLREGRFIVQNREKNRNSLKDDLGITERQREEEILSLSVENYYSGPKQDQYRAGHEYWEFGKMINGVEVYIKLQIAAGKDGEWGICISFHRAEWKMKYPFGENS